MTIDPFSQVIADYRQNGLYLDRLPEVPRPYAWKYSYPNRGYVIYDTEEQMEIRFFSDGEIRMYGKRFKRIVDQSLNLYKLQLSYKYVNSVIMKNKYQA